MQICLKRVSMVGGLSIQTTIHRTTLWILPSQTTTTITNTQAPATNPMISSKTSNRSSSSSKLISKETLTEWPKSKTEETSNLLARPSSFTTRSSIVCSNSIQATKLMIQQPSWDICKRVAKARKLERSSPVATLNSTLQSTRRPTTCSNSSHLCRMPGYQSSKPQQPWPHRDITIIISSIKVNPPLITRKDSQMDSKVSPPTIQGIRCLLQPLGKAVP